MAEENAEFVRLASELMMRAATGDKLLPWPELPQDLAFLAFLLDGQRAEVKRLLAALDYVNAHGCDEDSRTAQAALEWRWEPPGCCAGH